MSGSTPSDKLLDAFDAAWAAAESDDAPPPEIAQYLLKPQENDATSAEKIRLHYERLKEIDADYRQRRQTLCQMPGVATTSRVNADSKMPPLPELPDFHVEDILGRGGKGVVYKAQQISIRRTVAIKTILPDGVGSPREIERLRNEARVLGNLRHPNIVTVYSLEEHRGQCFLVMEYVSGRDLSFHQREQLMSAREAAAHMLTVSEAVAVAHHHNVLHRDIKPSNVLLDDDGNVRVTDFGLSRQLEASGSAAPLTASSEILGTPGYISPEQARGLSRDLDATTDVYGLGATLYALLTGIAPFTGSDVLTILQQVRDREPTAVRALQPGVPIDLQTICMKCLEKRPSDRYQSAQKLADDLRRFLNGEPIYARPLPSAMRAIRWCRRNSALAGLLGTIMALTVLLACLFIRRGIDNAMALAATSAQNQRLEKALEREKEATAEIYDTKMRLARLEYEANQIRNVELVLASMESRYAIGGVMPWEWNYLQSQMKGSVKHWEMAIQEAEWIGAVAFSPDNRLVAIGNCVPFFDHVNRSQNGRVTVLETSKGDVVAEFTDVLSVMCLMFTDDGEKLVAVDAGQGQNSLGYFPLGNCSIRQWNTATWEMLSKIPTDFSFESAQLSEDSRSLLALAVPPPPPPPPLSGSKSKQARNVALAASPGDPRVLAVVNLDGSEAIVMDRWRPLPDGPGFAGTLKDGTERRFNAIRPRVLRSTQYWIPLSAVFGSTLRVFAEKSSGVRTPMTVQVHRKQAGQSVIQDEDLFKLERSIPLASLEALAIDPNEKYLAVGTNLGEIRVWETATWKEHSPRRGHKARIRSLEFSNDGMLLASGDWDGTVRVWDMARGHDHVDTLAAFEGSRLESMAMSNDDMLVALVAGQPLQFTKAGRSESVSQMDVPGGVKFIAPGRVSDLTDDAAILALPSGDDSRILHLLNTSNGAIQGRLPAHATRISFVRFFDDLVATAAWNSRISERPSSDDGEIRLSQFDGTEVFATRLKSCRVYRITVSPDKKLIAASCQRYSEEDSTVNFIRTWNVETGQKLDEFSMADWTLALEFAASGRQLAAISFESGDFVLRDVIRQRDVLQMPALQQHLQDLRFTADGQRMVSASRREVLLWNTKTWRPVMDLSLQTFESDFVYNAQVKICDGGRKILANQADGTVRMWQIPE